jgi:hypothetical protein
MLSVAIFTSGRGSQLYHVVGKISFDGTELHACWRCFWFLHQSSPCCAQKSTHELSPARLQPYRIHPSIGLRLRRQQSNQMGQSPTTENISSTGPITAYLSDQSWLNWNSKSVTNGVTFSLCSIHMRWKVVHICFMAGSGSTTAPWWTGGPWTRRKMKQRPLATMASDGHLTGWRLIYHLFIILMVPPRLSFVTLIFCATFWLFILFKILILIYKIISHIVNIFSDKLNHKNMISFLINK